jgi:hypothetical protein
MINFDTFLIGLMIVSFLTGLVTEAVKKVLTDLKVNYQSNIVAGIVAAVLGVVVSIVYMVLTGVTFSAQAVALVFILAVASWLCSMVGYDKVIQVANQIKNIKKG